MKKIIVNTVLIIITVLLLLTLAKGDKGDPIFHQSQETRNTKVGSPFESSGSTSRYALTEAIVEDGTFVFNEDRARFSAPDMVEYNGKFFSIFAPGVSFIGVPFYVVGKYFGMTQIFTYLSTVMFALLNVFLVSKLARKFGAGLYSSLLAGFIFLFGTNALSYALTFTQHPASTAIILLALLNAFGDRTLLKNLWFGVLVGVGLLFDIPNVLMMAPIGLYVVVQHFQLVKNDKKIKVTFKLSIISLIIGLIPFIALFGWYNKQLTGSYTKIGQTIGRSDYFDPLEVKQERRIEESKNTTRPKIPLYTRDQISGLYMLVVSNQRGIFYYSPVLLFGLAGMYILYKSKRSSESLLLVAVILVNLTLYSMFGDSAGGWAFGPRYLIPAAAILSAGIGLVLQKYKKNLLFIAIFIVLSAYSIGVNVVGAMTTTQVPPKVEAVNLADPIPYTYEYNLQLIDQGKNSSLVYNRFLSDRVRSAEFVYVYFFITLFMAFSLYTALIFEKDKEGKI